MRKIYLYALSIAFMSVMGLKAQETPNYRWEFNLGMVNPFNNQTQLFKGFESARGEALLPDDKSLGLGLKYAFGSYAWRFSVSGNSAYYSYANPNLNVYRQYDMELEQGDIEFRMGVEKRMDYTKIQFYFGSDLVMGRVRQYEEGAYELLDTEGVNEWWTSRRTKVSGVSLFVGMKYFIHEHFSLLLETRADALGYEILKNSHDTESIKDTASQFVLRPFGMMSINYHF